MKDIIKDALDESEKKRSAAGEVDGKPLRLVKESYESRTQSIEWHLKVYVSDDQTPSSKETGLTASKAEEMFWNLVEKYDLETIQRDDEYTDQNDEPKIISHVECEECDSDRIKQVSDVMRAPGFVDSCKGRCMSCGNKQDVPMQ